MATTHTDEQLMEALSASVDAGSYFLITPANINNIITEITRD